VVLAVERAQLEVLGLNDGDVGRERGSYEQNVMNRVLIKLPTLKKNS
jgi:hypothetical protein